MLASFGQAEDVVAQAQVQRQPAVDAPVVLPKEAVLPIAGLKVPAKCANRVGAHEPGKQFRVLKAGEGPMVGRCGGERAAAIAAVVDPEIALGVVSLIPIHVAMNNVGAKLEGVLALDPAH